MVVLPVCFLLATTLPANDSKPSPVLLDDIAAEAGLDFVLDNWASPNKHMIEPMTGGVAVFDYNNDGLSDVFFTNGAVVTNMEKSDPRYYNRLYRNEGSLKFKDVTLEAGVMGAGYSMGAAAGDFNNDGNVDLFVAGVFKNTLHRNRGDGTFEEITDKARIKSDLWSVAAGWFDYDNDGLLDLLVVNYVEWTPVGERFCGDKARNLRMYCHPKYYTGVKNQLYHNRGDGTFEDVTEKSGIGAHPSRGMSVAFEDFDRDGRIDFYVTNDKLPNSLFRNLGDGTFEEVALMAGAALREHGKPVSSMGADARDYDNDGLPDILVTALEGETFPIFRNIGDGMFEDATYFSQMARLSMKLSSWSNGFADFNNDGWKDIFSANSHVNDLVEIYEATSYQQPNAVFLNLGDGRFDNITAAVGPEFQVARPHRGSAFGDFDNDGRIDVVVTSIQEVTELWHNVSPTVNNWIRLKLRGTRSNRDGIGTKIRIGPFYNFMSSAVGYASSTHEGVHFGLGKMDRIEKIEITWPSGTVQVLENVAVNQILTVEEPSS